MSVLIAMGVVFALRRLTRTLTRRLTNLAARTDSVLDDLVVDVLSRTRWAFHIAMGLLAGSYFVDLPESWDLRLHQAIAVVLFIQVAHWASGAVDHMVVVFLEHRAPNQDVAHRTGRNIMRTVGVGGIWTLAIVACLDHLQVPIRTFVTGLGVTGVFVALAGQQIGSDLFASASILLDQPFLVGDYIVVDGLRGTVERIGVRTTHLRSIDGERIVFANSDLAKSRLRNFRTMIERRVAFTFGIRHDTPSARIVALGERLKHVFEGISKTRLERATWHSFGTYALMYEVVYHVLDREMNVYMQIQQDVNVKLLQAMEAEHIALAVGTPVRVVGNQDLNQALAAAGTLTPES